jgi:acyl-CoA synthetase (AMP-forming)/AMP-acid ligase II
LRYGDVLAILSPNMPEFPFLYVGAIGAGYVPNPCSPVATPEELARMLDTSQPVGYVVHTSLLPVFREARRIRGESEGLSDVPLVIMGRESVEGFRNLHDLRQMGAARPMPFEPLRRPAAETIALLPYSSGTSGAFKCVSLSHRNLVANVLQLRQGWPGAF